METSLHQQLKRCYADGDANTEVVVGKYRIDAIRDEELIEVQCASLSAIRDKCRHLLKRHPLRVVKPVVSRIRIVKLDKPNGTISSRRMSPARGSVLDVFDELIYFTRVFPHPNLAIEVPLVEIEEWRYPGHGRRRRRRERDHQVEDRKLLSIVETHRFDTAEDLGRLVPDGMPSPFHTGHLAATLGIDRWDAQRIAYCFRKMGTARQVGKQGNARLYKFAERSDAAA